MNRTHEKRPPASRKPELAPYRATPPVDLHVSFQLYFFCFFLTFSAVFQDQLWRVCAAIQQLAEDLFRLESIGQVGSHLLFKISTSGGVLVSQCPKPGQTGQMELNRTKQGIRSQTGL